MDASHHIKPGGFDQFPALLTAWRAQHPRCGVLVLLPEAEQARVPALQAAARQADVPLLGAIFPALVLDNGFATHGACVVRFNEMPPHFLVGGALPNRVQALRDGLEAVLPPPGAPQRPTLWLVFDAMVPDIATVLGSLALSAGGRVRFAGVNAGSETFQPMPCLFDRERLVGNGALGVLLPPGRTEVVEHGYPVSKALMTATSTQGNRVALINRRPAFEVYQEVVRAEYGVELTRENFYQLAVHFPFGVVMAIDVLVRIPVAFDDSGALVCVGEVPPNSVLRLLRAPALEDSHCVEAVSRAVARHQHPRGETLLTFYCAGRRMHFGEDAGRELTALKAATGVVGLCGALTLGEIDTLPDLELPRFHNATVVCLP